MEFATSETRREWRTPSSTLLVIRVMAASSTPSAGPDR